MTIVKEAAKVVVGLIFAFLVMSGLAVIGQLVLWIAPPAILERLGPVPTWLLAALLGSIALILLFFVLAAAWALGNNVIATFQEAAEEGRLPPKVPTPPPPPRRPKYR